MYENLQSRPTENRGREPDSFCRLLGAVVSSEPFFSFSVRADNLILNSDQPFSGAAAKHVLELTEAKLARSPLYSGRQDHHIFICNAHWRQMLFFNKDYGVGGVAQYPVTANVFLRDALIEDNRLISPRGTPVLGDRTLDYFIAHEITHQLTGHAIGPVRYFQLPQWVREDMRTTLARAARLITPRPGALFWREYRKWIGGSPVCTGVSIWRWPTFWIIVIGAYSNCYGSRHQMKLSMQPLGQRSHNEARSLGGRLVAVGAAFPLSIAIDR
jgi:hypothetical protein